MAVHVGVRIGLREAGTGLGSLGMIHRRKNIKLLRAKRELNAGGRRRVRPAIQESPKAKSNDSNDRGLKTESSR
jgi:hypothetical protein